MHPELEELLRTVGSLKSTYDLGTLAQINPSSSPADLADAYLMSRGLDMNGLRLRHHRGSWLRYDGRIYRTVPREELTADIMAYLRSTPARDRATQHTLNSILVNLTATESCLVPSSTELPAKKEGDSWVTCQNLVIVENGILDLAAVRKGSDTQVLSPHTPNLVSTVILPYAYDPTAQCPRWIRFLDEIFPDESCRQLLQQIFGYCLTLDTSLQKFFVFIGTGANGKSVVLAVLRLLVGAENVSALPLAKFGSNHELVITLGKLLNITSEVGEVERIDEGLLKQFTGGDIMHFNPKYEKPFTAKPTAKLVVGTNTRPAFKDRSDGTWRRLIVLPFPVVIPEDKRNPCLENDLAKELSGILNWAIAGAHALYEQGRFIETQTALDAREQFRRESSSARLFLGECCYEQTDGEMPKRKLYSLYKDYCDSRGYKPSNAHTFCDEVKSVFPRIEECKPRTDEGSRPRCYKGIALLPTQ